MAAVDSDPSTSLPAGSVVITPTQIYAEVRAMGQELGRLTTMLDPALTTLREDIAEVRGSIVKEVAASKLARDDMKAEATIVHEKHEARLQSLDKRLWVASIVTAAVAAGSGAGIAQLLPLLTR